MKILNAYHDERGAVKFNLQNYPPAWTNVYGSSTASSNQKKIDELGRKVAFLYAASRTISTHCTRVPWQLIRRTTAEPDIVTTSEHDFFPVRWDWLTYMQDVVELGALSLVMTGQAYFLKVGNRIKVKELQFVVPSTMTPEYDDMGDVIGFTRRWTDKDGKVQEKLYPANEVLYFWGKDAETENGPPKSWPAAAAFGGAEVLRNLQHMKAGYFENGMIGFGYFTPPDHISPPEAETTKTYIKEMFSGAKRAFRKTTLFRSGLDYHRISDGLDEIDNSSLIKVEREDILAALGVPPDMVLAPAGGMDSDITSAVVTFYDGVVVPMVELIIKAINKQMILDPNYKLKATPDEMLIFQENKSEEAQVKRDKAEAYRTLVSSGVDKAIAQFWADLETVPDDVLAMVEPEPEPEPQEVEEADEPEPSANDEIKALINWCKKRKDKECHPRDFKSDVLEYDEIAEIMQDQGVYYPPIDVDYTGATDNAFMKLAELIASNDKAQPLTINVTPEGHTVNITPEAHTINVTQPEVKAVVAVPDVVVNIGEQPQPVINVEAPNVKIENSVEFPKRMTEKTTVTRGRNGEITGTASISEFEE